MTCRFSIITLFPDMFDALRNEGVIARAIAAGLIALETIPLRDFASDVRKTVDSHPVGGGDGMVLRPDIVDSALQSFSTEETLLLYMTPGGKVFHNAFARELATRSHVGILCGRYAGIDERLIEKYKPIPVSIGDFVLSGGELPAMCLIDSVSRFIPGVLGNECSAVADSFEDGLLEAPVYGKPILWNEKKIPDILLSGDHKKMTVWRRREQLKKTARVRPDLIRLIWDDLSRSEKEFVEKVWKYERTI